MIDYNQYFVFDEKFIKKYSPYPGFSFDSPIEQIVPYDGPLRSVEQLKEFMEAFLKLLIDNELDEHASELLYFATLIPRIEQEFKWAKPVSEQINNRKHFLDQLKEFPLDFEYHDDSTERYVWFEENDQGSDQLKRLYTLSEKTIKKHKSLPKLRALAHHKNFYYNTTTGEPIVSDHKQIEISRHIEITIKSTLDDKLSVIVPDVALNEKAISGIIRGMLEYQSPNSHKYKYNNIGRPRELTRHVVSTVSHYILKYIFDKTGLKKPTSGPVSNSQAEFLFDYFGILGWLEKKPNHHEEFAKKPKPNHFLRQLATFERTYLTKKETEGYKANYIRGIIKSN